MLRLPVRKALRREAAQAEAQGDRHRDPPQLRAPAGALPPPEDPPRAAPDRGVRRDPGLRLGAGVRQPGQHPRVPGRGAVARGRPSHGGLAALGGAAAGARQGVPLPGHRVQVRDPPGGWRETGRVGGRKWE